MVVELMRMLDAVQALPPTSSLHCSALGRRDNCHWGEPLRMLIGRVECPSLPYARMLPNSNAELVFGEIRGRADEGTGGERWGGEGRRGDGRGWEGKRGERDREMDRERVIEREGSRDRGRRERRERETEEAK